MRLPSRQQRCGRSSSTRRSDMKRSGAPSRHYHNLPSNETGSLHLFLGSAPLCLCRSQPRRARQRRRNQSNTKNPCLMSVPIKLSPRKTTLRISRPTGNIGNKSCGTAQDPGISASTSPTSGPISNCRKVLIYKMVKEDPEQYDEWLLYHKGRTTGPKPIKRVDGVRRGRGDREPRY